MAASSDAPVTSVTGILISKAIYSKKCFLNFVRSSDQLPFVALLLFPNEPNNVRSYCRRNYKVGNEIQIFQGVWKPKQQNDDANLLLENGLWFLIHDDVSLNNITTFMQVVKERAWDIEKCRRWKSKYLPHQDETSSNVESSSKAALKTKKTHRRSSFLKRGEGEILANFLINMIAWKISEEDSLADPNEWGLATIQPSDAVLEALQNGVWDVAGGIGLVSMSLSLRGIRATVVDPRKTAGCLTKRDRRMYKNALLQSPFLPPFETKRAWVGEPPHGIDDRRRNVDQARLPVLNESCEASCIVALHPDEATDAVIDLAVQHRVPFCVVPCCVFAKLFPDRKKPDGGPVSSYEDLLDYLQAKDESIRRTPLPFEGSNIALWSIF